MNFNLESALVQPRFLLEVQIDIGKGRIMWRIKCC